MKYIIYCRKSSVREDRQVLSNPAQKRELTKFANEENLQIVDSYEEEMSAHKIGRPKFNEILARIEKGEVNGILVWDESRLARNSKDGGNIIYMIDLEQLVEIRKPGKVYRNTPDDKSWLNMCFMMSKKESDDKSVNVKRGLREKAERGWLPTGAKPGYINDKHAEKGNKTVLKHPTNYGILQKAIDLVLDGQASPPKAWEQLNKWGYRTPIRKSIGGKPMARSQFYEVLTDPFYYGYIEFPQGSGNWYKGAHEPMITQEEGEKLRMLLGRNNSPRPQHKEFPYSMFFACGRCQGAMSPDEKWHTVCTECKTKFASEHRSTCPKCQIKVEDMDCPTIRHYVYYCCKRRRNPNCKQGSIEVNILEQEVDKLLSQIEISEKFKDWAIKWLNKANKQEKNERTATQRSLQDKYNDITKRIDNLLALKISPHNADGELLSDREFLDQKQSLMNQKELLNKEINQTDKRLDRWVEDAEKLFNYACYARYWFNHGDIEQKRAVIRGLGSNLQILNKSLQVNEPNPLFFIRKAKEIEVSISPMFEPAFDDKSEPVTDTKRDPLGVSNPLWLRR